MFRWSTLVFFSVFFSNSALPENLKAMLQESDAVLVGVNHSRTQTKTSVSAGIDVLRVLKGPFKTGDSVSASWAGDFNEPKGTIMIIGPERDESKPIVQQSVGLWFLKKTGTGWRFLSAQHGAFYFNDLFYEALISPPDAALVGMADPPIEVVAAAEILAVLENPPTRYDMPVGEAFLGVDSPAIRTMFWHVVKSSNAHAFGKAEVSSLLIGAGDADIIKFLTKDPYLTAYDEHTRIIALTVRNDFRATDSAAVGNLIELAESPKGNIELLAAARWAIAAIHTPQTLPFLASLLDSDNHESQVRGIVGLSSFANGCPVRTSANVAQGEYMQPSLPSRYRNKTTGAHSFLGGFMAADRHDDEVAFWKSWWLAHRREFEKA